MIDRIDTGALQLTGSPAARKKDLRETAREFEALLIAQMLRSAREAGSSSGWLGTGEDSTSDSAMQMAEEQFAAELSRQGGLGLASLVASGLKARTPGQ